MTLMSAGEYPDVYRTEMPRARKQYQCQECGATIRPGEVYRRDFTAIMGEGETFICCTDCDELMARFFKALNAEKLHDLTFEIGGLRGAIRELHSEYGVRVEGDTYPPAEVQP